MKWIADFRDPWTEISYYKHLKLTKSSDKKHRSLEQKVFENADVTLATSYSDAENFRKKGAKSICITNGFEVLSEDKNKVDVKSDKFTLSYVGVLEQLRDPGVLWYVLYEILNENSQFAKDFELKFVGKIDPQILHNFRKIGIDHVIKNLGYLSHYESNIEMKNSSLLLITNFPQESSKGIIPGKIFEYLATGNQILSFGPKDADVAMILEKTNAGKHFGYEEKENVKNYILSIYKNWKSGKLQSENANIEEFSRKNLTKKLSEIL